MKPVIGRILAWIFAPIRATGRFLFRFVLVPNYQLFLFIRRSLHRLYLPAKNKVLFLFSNRYAIHAAIVLIAVFSVATNVRASEVRADILGGESVLVTILGAESPDTVVEVTATPAVVSAPVSYQGHLALTSTVAKDLEYQPLSGEALTGAPALTAPGVSETAAPAAERETIETYLVQEGDTIGSIAEKFDLSITTILWANNLSVRSIIRPGDELTVLPVDGVTHKVKSGDTLSRIAKTYGATTDEIITANKLADGNDLSIGESLLIPGGEKIAPAPSRSVASVRSLFTPTQAGVKSPLAGTANMIWPTDLGKINTYFGQYYIYGRHWGLDVDCNYNNNNYAAADGIVTYADWARGYGYLIKIDHGNGLETRYGHHAKLYVKKGQTVAQGDALGLCGTTGQSTGTHLHFEVRVNGQVVNPLNYISYNK